MYFTDCIVLVTFIFIFSILVVFVICQKLDKLDERLFELEWTVRRNRNCSASPVIFTKSISQTRLNPLSPRYFYRPLIVGAATHQGNVRTSNQDRVHANTVGEYAVLVVSDGCGGHPFGEEAAELAADKAFLSVTKSLGSLGQKPKLLELCQQAIFDASQSLQKEAIRRQFSKPADGFRTTLIVIVANESSIAFAYIGDGGGTVVNPTGKVTHFIKPQKDQTRRNVLTASLGPTQEGQSESGFIRRKPGDFIIAGTDGVFDRIEESFFGDVYSIAKLREGNLAKTALQVVEDLTACRDKYGYICDDNTTIAIIGDAASFGGDSSKPTNRKPAKTTQLVSGMPPVRV